VVCTGPEVRGFMPPRGADVQKRTLPVAAARTVSPSHINGLAAVAHIGSAATPADRPGIAGVTGPSWNFRHSPGFSFLLSVIREGTMRAAALESEATHHSLIPSDRVEGTAVRRSNGEKIGEIKRVMIDKVSGKVAYAVMRFGGFLGMGEKYHPLPWDALRYNTALEAYELNLPDEQLREAPSYGTGGEFDWGDRERERRLHEYYKVPPYWGV